MFLDEQCFRVNTWHVVSDGFLSLLLLCTCERVPFRAPRWINDRRSAGTTTTTSRRFKHAWNGAIRRSEGTPEGRRERERETATGAGESARYLFVFHGFLRFKSTRDSAVLCRVRAPLVRGAEKGTALWRGSTLAGRYFVPRLRREHTLPPPPVPRAPGNMISATARPELTGASRRHWGADSVPSDRDRGRRKPGEVTRRAATRALPHARRSPRPRRRRRAFVSSHSVLSCWRRAVRGSIARAIDPFASWFLFSSRCPGLPQHTPWNIYGPLWHPSTPSTVSVRIWRPRTASGAM